MSSEMSAIMTGAPEDPLPHGLLVPRRHVSHLSRLTPHIPLTGDSMPSSQHAYLIEQSASSNECKRAAPLLQLYFDYRRDVGTIDRQISEIERSYRRSLGEGLWNLDARQLELQVDGILHLPDIRFVEVREATDRADPMVVIAGSHQANADVHREFPIFHMNRGAEQTLGVLSIEATFHDVYRRLFETAIVILISQGAKTFVVSFFTLYIVNRLITRHLVTAARFLGGYDLRRSPPPLRLERRPPRQVDELDQLVRAFNGMCVENSRLYRDLEDREYTLQHQRNELRTLANRLMYAQPG